MERKSFAACCSFFVLVDFFWLQCEAASTIDIGFTGPFTGPVAFNGGEMRKGAMLEVDEINAKGGLFRDEGECCFRRR